MLSSINCLRIDRIGEKKGLRRYFQNATNWWISFWTLPTDTITLHSQTTTRGYFANLVLEFRQNYTIYGVNVRNCTYENLYVDKHSSIYLVTHFAPRRFYRLHVQRSQPSPILLNEFYLQVDFKDHKICYSCRFS